ncbi:acyl-coenzyme A thioesterase PaaI-like protein [Novosphingobium chloroacetimidivorans]|uniref:Acyl-coenzyme A thioesterase PaaI-like protein n=1 Tax=Novosphingobium chloroacetimidivorans TaxID=1428314 RepID=A0A7W7NWL3_9SPHN|nr:PaaI family thioesterase [Novosphingobium chloroacetimidivorans]MBB4858529.1 acyl-coenzyme A thioesterase PaaI-like protein [Novosphingobium chloroacetimidivorans]
MKPTSAFIHELDDAHPGWHTWDLADQTRFNPAVIGRMIIRREGERGARLRMLDTQVRHSNLHGAVHGGVTLAVVDIAMFATIYTVLGADVAGSVTLDLNCQFIGAGLIGGPLDVCSEVMKETGRLVFLRGTVEQPQGLVASYMGTLRKPSRT